MKVEEPIVDYNSLDLNGTYTYLDYMKWQFTERVELIKGKILKMSPAPNRRHQAILVNLFKPFQYYFKNQKCKWYPAPFDVRLPIPKGIKDSTVVQPDICVICDIEKLDEQGCNGSPDLVVEVLSPGNSKHEMNTKFELYEQAGVREYWIIQPETKLVLLYVLDNGIYKGLRPFIEGQTFNSVVFPELEVVVDELFFGI